MGPLKRTLVRKHRRPHPRSDCPAFAAETPTQKGQKKKEENYVLSTEYMGCIKTFYSHSDGGECVT